MKTQWLLFATFALSVYGTGQVWLVQLSSYPLWRFVGDKQFHDYHRAWWRSIWGVVLVPAALTFLGAIAMVWWSVPEMHPWVRWLGAALQMVGFAGTALWWGPLMARLENADGGLDRARYVQLMTTHWLRVGLITAYSVLVGWVILSILPASS